MSDFCECCGQLLPLDVKAARRWAIEAEDGRCSVCGKDDPHIKYSGHGFTHSQTGEISPWMCAECAKTWPERK